jgi:hypothetical protein
MELWWPLFPAFILTSTLTGIPGSQADSYATPYSLPVMIVLGLLFILRDGAAGGENPADTDVRRRRVHPDPGAWY